MDPNLIQLVLAYPTSIEVQLLDAIAQIDAGQPAFTTLQAEGHGHGYAHAGVREQVRGRVARGLVLMVLPQSRAEALVAGLAQVLPVKEIAYWMTPVLQFGRLGA